MKYNQFKKIQPVHILITGEPKTGKTLLTATVASKGFKMLYLSLDNGLMTLFHKVPQELLENNFEFIRLPDTTDFPVAYQTILRLVRGERCNICDAHGQVECTSCKGKLEKSWTSVCLPELGPEWIVVMDHATQLTKSAMNAYVKRINKDPETFKFEWDDWRKLGVMLDRIFLPIQQSLNNWIVLAHVAEVEQEDKQKKLTAAIGTGNYARNSGGFFDHVVYCEVMNSKHNIGSSTTFSLRAITGSRSDIAIEKLLDKDGRATLLPFFDGTIPVIEKRQNGEEQAEKVFAIAADAIMTISANPIDTPIPIEQAPAAGNVTSLHVATPPAQQQPTQQQPSMAMNPSAMAALERLRATKGK